MEFSQYRNYEPGDDLRLLDWKMLARSTRYYIKQAEQDSNVVVKFIIDASASMSFKENEISKLEYAKVLAATLGYLSNKQGDEIGVYALNNTSEIKLYPKINKQHYNRFLQALLTITSEGIWPKESSASATLHSRGKKELIFFITDMYQEHGELSKFLKELKTLRNEVLVLHLISKKEQNLGYQGVVTFEDLETGKRIKVDANASRQQYVKNWEKSIALHKKELADRAIGYHTISLDDNISEVIHHFVKQRNRLH